jgi:hypothetical protein
MFGATLGDAKNGLVKKWQRAELEAMDWPAFVDMPFKKRREWVIAKLVPFERQFYESAAAYKIPVQLLATVVLNELLDINWKDLAQEQMEVATHGSFGIAQIEVSTALKDDLLPLDPQTLQLAMAYGAEGALVKGYLQVPQYAIDAAAKEIRILLDRMSSNPSSKWLQMHNYTPGSTSGQDIYSSFSGSQEDREAALATIVDAAYNSPDILVAQHPENYKNGPIMGTYADTAARLIYRLRLFRPECQ